MSATWEFRVFCRDDGTVRLIDGADERRAPEKLVTEPHYAVNDCVCAHGTRRGQLFIRVRNYSFPETRLIRNADWEACVNRDKDCPGLDKWDVTKTTAEQVTCVAQSGVR
jgi:hypothetical protein